MGVQLRPLVPGLVGQSQRLHLYGPFFPTTGPRVIAGHRDRGRGVFRPPSCSPYFLQQAPAGLDKTPNRVQVPVADYTKEQEDEERASAPGPGGQPINRAVRLSVSGLESVCQIA